MGLLLEDDGLREHFQRPQQQIETKVLAPAIV